MSTLIIGGGYAGVMAANRLGGRGVTLVTSQPAFVERIRLHAVAGEGRPDARRDYGTILHPDAALVVDTVTLIDDGFVELASGRRLPYDTLVYAVGSAAGSASGLHHIASEQGATGLRDELAADPDATVTVVGAGLTGVELAGALADAGRRVRVIAASEPARRGPAAHLDALRARGVQVEFGRHPLTPGAPERAEDDAGAGAGAGPASRAGVGRASRADAGIGTGPGTGVERGTGTPREIVVDATGFTYPDLAARSGLPTDAQGRLIVDATLTVPGHPRILGAGDAVFVDAPSARHLRPACATALPMGAHVADVIIARRRGEEPPELDLGYLAQCTDLGGGRGHVQFVESDDTERSLALTGRAGGLVKEAVCRMTLRWLAQERERPGRYTWARGPRPAAPDDSADAHQREEPGARATEERSAEVPVPRGRSGSRMTADDGQTRPATGARETDGVAPSSITAPTWARR